MATAKVRIEFPLVEVVEGLPLLEAPIRVISRILVLGRYFTLFIGQNGSIFEEEEDSVTELSAEELAEVRRVAKRFEDRFAW